MRTLEPQEIMAQTSMHALNDLGSMKECQSGSVADLATYSTLQLNITHIPIPLISGLCLPAECSQAQLSSFIEKTTNGVNNLLVKAQKKFDLVDLTKGYGLVKDYSRLTISLTQTDQAVEEW